MYLRLSERGVACFLLDMMRAIPHDSRAAAWSWRLFISFSHTLTPTHTNTHTHSFSLSLARSLYLSSFRSFIIYGYLFFVFAQKSLAAPADVNAITRSSRPTDGSGETTTSGLIYECESDDRRSFSARRFRRRHTCVYGNGHHSRGVKKSPGTCV